MHAVTRHAVLFVVPAILIGTWQPALAQASEVQEAATFNEAASPEDEDREDTESGSLDDSTGSIEAGHEPIKQFLYRGWSGAGDLRAGYVRSESDRRDGSEGTESDWRARVRYGGRYDVNDWLKFNARLALACTTTECDPELSLDPSDTRVLSVDQGTVTFDEFYLHAFRFKRFDVAIGRLQTKFTTRAGVYAKSLDRNNSNAVNINWTDGIHATYHLRNESIVHFIAEYNDENGASNVRRSPLDFTPSSARWGYFVAWESLQRSGAITQRGIDITYLPKALLTDGDLSGPRDDYIGVVGRLGAARPFGNKGRRWNVTGEIGYAPETPTKAAVDQAGDGDVDGLAWAVTASIMDFWPSHSFGINYANTDPGWLLSPQYRNNEELLEVRYLWRKSEDLVIDARIRWREELDQQVTQTQKLDEYDFFARFTFRF